MGTVFTINVNENESNSDSLNDCNDEYQMMMMMMIAEITVGTGMEIQQLSSVRRTKREQNNYIGSNFV